MAAASVQNPPTQSESKSSKKKKAKVAAAAAERTESPAPAATPDKPASVSGNNEISENAYIRELKKGIRNTNKKIGNASKTQALVDEHKSKGKTPEELVELKVINADQKKQVDNLNSLKAEVARLEEQLAQYEKIDGEYRAQVASVKADIEKTHEQDKADAVAEVKKQAEVDAKKSLHDGLLVLSQFLRLAAHRRAEAPESTEDEDQALEGILLGVYGGDESAVSVMLRLCEGTEDKTVSVGGETLQTTYATVKASAAAHPAPLYQTAAEAETETEPIEAAEDVQTDPTIANAGLTEIDAGTDTALTNGHSDEAAADSTIPNADVGDAAANTAGENQWDTGNDLAASQEWVKVPTPSETSLTVDAPAVPVVAAAAPAAANTASWADDHPETTPEASTPTDPNDGFQSVQRRGGNRGGRGRGRGGGFRGDGFRGRGRGGPRGGHRGGPRRDAPEASS
ncbi:hypothetical protein UCDDA912_g05796 [Diaporthe ampelina]|uniref:YAG7-like dimerisation domain-containing protein n=1 Tax=Diaporthe ampelina TaxID=1214573 RepID=A0A0G2FIH7_9PEZI|nr:hypothetical protein UCDDA912_g05796 [Diaporthe ampelina]